MQYFLFLRILFFCYAGLSGKFPKSLFMLAGGARTAFSSIRKMHPSTSTCSVTGWPLTEAQHKNCSSRGPQLGWTLNTRAHILRYKGLLCESQCMIMHDCLLFLIVCCFGLCMIVYCFWLFAVLDWHELISALQESSGFGARNLWHWMSCLTNNKH